MGGREKVGLLWRRVGGGTLVCGKLFWGVGPRGGRSRGSPGGCMPVHIVLVAARVHWWWGWNRGWLVGGCLGVQCWGRG